MLGAVADIRAVRRAATPRRGVGRHLSLLRPKEARRVLDPKLDAVEAADVDYLVAVNPGCLRQWQGGLPRRRTRVTRRPPGRPARYAAAGGRPLPTGLPIAARLPQVRLPSGMRVRRVFRLRRDAAQNTDGWSA